MDPQIDRMLRDATDACSEAAAEVAKAEKSLAEARERYKAILSIANAGGGWVRQDRPSLPCIARTVPPRPYDWGPELIVGDLGLLMLFEGLEDHYGNQVGWVECWL